ncbi:MAG TPA: PA domain-containing protein, partial [bacterium]|nr:PA domain-containing protein [bacterium]
MHLRPWALALAVLIPVIPAAATTPEAPWPSPARLKADIEYLASDALEGRFPGTRGCEQAAGYIAAQMEAAGLEPGGDDGTYFDGFSFTSGVDLGSGNAARLDAGGLLSQLEVNEDFVPLFFSPNGIAAGPVVFAGYGISAEEFAYDDYAGLDVAGKVVLVLRHEPGVDDPASPFKGKGMTRYADLRTKAIRARLAGAVALLAVTGPASPGAKNDTLMELRQADGYGEVGIPVVNLTRRAADLLLSTVGQTVSNLQQTIDTSYSPASLDLPGTTAELQVDLERVATQTANVVGVLSGTDPAMAHQLVIVGAHYDHLGMGQTGSLHTGPAAIHNGADDNASG